MGLSGGLADNGGVSVSVGELPASVVTTSSSLGGGLTGTLPNPGVVRFLPFTQSGTLSVQTGSLRFRFPSAVTIDSVAITVGTAPTGATILVDVNKNGTTIFTTQANRPSIAISGNASTDAVPDVTAFAAGDYLTVDIDQIGSTAPGQDLVATVKYH